MLGSGDSLLVVQGVRVMARLAAGGGGSKVALVACGCLEPLVAAACGAAFKAEDDTELLLNCLKALLNLSTNQPNQVS
jgi:hypothetical protein